MKESKEQGAIRLLKQALACFDADGYDEESFKQAIEYLGENEVGEPWTTAQAIREWLRDNILV